MKLCNKLIGGGIALILILLGASYIMKNPHRERIRVETPLIDAVLEGNLDLVKKLIAEGANVNEQDEWLETPLIRAIVHSNDLPRVEALLAAKARVDMQDHGGYSALMFASEGDHYPIAQLLIDAGANVNLQDEGGSTALMNASFGGYFPTVQALLAAGADVNIKNRDGDTALNRSHTLAITKALLNAGADVNNQDYFGFTPLWSNFANYDLVRTLIDAGADVNIKSKEGFTVLWRQVAMAPQSLDALQAVLDAGADLAAKYDDGESILHVAARGGWKPPCCHGQEYSQPDYLPVIKRLIKAGADVNARDDKGNTPLMVAYDDRIKEALKEAGAQ